MWGSGGSNYAYGFYGEQRELENHGVSSNVNWNRYYNRQEKPKCCSGVMVSSLCIVVDNGICSVVGSCGMCSLSGLF